MYAADLTRTRYTFADLKTLRAKASPRRSGDRLAAVAAGTDVERFAAQLDLADLPLATVLSEIVVPYEIDDVSRLIIDGHDAAAFRPVAHLTVGGFRDWLLSDAATTEALRHLGCGLTPEMAAAISKISRNQDLVAIAATCASGAATPNATACRTSGRRACRTTRLPSGCFIFAARRGGGNSPACYSRTRHRPCPARICSPA